MSAILVAVTGPQADAWASALHGQGRQLDIRVWPDHVGGTADIVYACVWNPPPGLLATFPNLKAVINLGAGVDHLLTDPMLPPVAIGRVVHSDLTMRVTEYVLLHVLIYHRRQRLYDRQQADHIWHAREQPAASEVAVGVMGLGAIGGHAARLLAQLGFKVAGWSQTPKNIPGVEVFVGRHGLDGFLRRTEILVCLLPRTHETEGIVNLSLLRKLKRDGAAGGAYLINAGRGALQIDRDIVAALDQGVLAAATLDVFENEPLPPDSRLWADPRITITPHNAGDVSPAVFAPRVVAQIERFERGLPLDHPVDRTRGY